MTMISFYRYAMSAIIVIALSAVTARASIVASWDLTGDPGNQVTEPAASSAAGIIGSAMIRGAGLGTSAGVNSFNSNNWDDEVDEFIEFGFTVLPGMTVDLTNLIIATRSSPTGPGTVGLFTSLDSYLSPIFSFVQTPGDNFVNSIVDLSALPTLGPGAFTVRLIEIGDTQADGDGDTGGAGTFRVAEHLASGVLTDVQFNGTIAAVPEMSAFMVWGLLFSVGALKLRRF